MAASPKQPILPSPEAAAPPQQLKGLVDELWEEIFLRVASPFDIARASTTCSSFRRLIADPTFLRRHRSIHPQPVLGFIIAPNVGPFRFKPVEAPNPNAPAASALAAAAGFTFDYIPQPQGKPYDVRDGRILLGRPTAWNDDCRFPDLTVCDPLSRRSLLLPRVPGDLLLSSANKKARIFPVLMPRGCEEEDASSFRVLCMMYCLEKFVVLIFSSSSGCWNIVKSTTWDALGLAMPIVTMGLRTDYACGCVYWKVLFSGMNKWISKLIQFNIKSLEFCTIDFPPDHSIMMTTPSIVEASESRLGMFSVTRNQQSLHYATRQNLGLRSNEWKTEDTISLPEGYHHFDNVGALEGYIILYGSSARGHHRDYFSLEVKTLKIERIGTTEKSYGRVYPYIGFPPIHITKRT